LFLGPNEDRTLQHGAKTLNVRHQTASLRHPVSVDVVLNRITSRVSLRNTNHLFGVSKHFHDYW
jgi:hypothetical protein